MKSSPLVCLCTALVSPIFGATAFHAEAGGSAFFLRQHGPLEPGRGPNSLENPEKSVPFVAVAMALSEAFALRLSYHALNDVETTAMFGSPPSDPSPPLPVVVWGHYRDDVHLLTVTPEFKWRIHSALTLGAAPQLNWVKSDGVISYSTNNALVLLQAPRERDDDGFTLGATTRLSWAVGSRVSASLSYQYSDLGPSFHRRAHVVSAGLEWKF